VKKSRKIAEGLSALAPMETVIFLDFEGMQCPVNSLRQTHLQGEAISKHDQRFQSLNFHLVSISNSTPFSRPRYAAFSLSNT